MPVQQRQFPFRNRWLGCHQAQIVRANILAFDQAGNFAARRGPSRLARRTKIIEGDTVAGSPQAVFHAATAQGPDLGCGIVLDMLSLCGDGEGWHYREPRGAKGGHLGHLFLG